MVDPDVPSPPIRTASVPLTIALPRERREGERRVALVPAAVRRLLDVPGVAVRIESGCGRAAGFHDAGYDGVEIVPDFVATVAGADIVCKVGLPTLAEIERLVPGTVLVSLTRAFAHLPEIEALATGHVTTIAMDLVPRTPRGRAMDALSSQATVAGYKAALLAAELSPRLFPMMTTAAGTIRPSRVIVIGAGVAGLQAIATARRLGAEVEAYDIRPQARERIESLGARMIDTGVEGADAHGHARALRRDEQQLQHDVLAERLARAHAVICAASIPNRPAPCIVTRDMVEGMLPDTVIVDMAATTGGNCELTRAGEHVQHGDKLIVGPLNLPSHGAVHASEMYARNVTNMLGLIVGADGTLALDGDDDILARTVLTHAGDVCDASTAALMERTAHPFGDVRKPAVDEEADTESGWASEAPEEVAVPVGEAIGDTGEADGVDGQAAVKVDRDAGQRVAAVSGGRAAEAPAPGAAGERGATDIEADRSRSGDGNADEDAVAADAPPDDLTVIDGVGPALQERLYAFGVTRLATLAELDEPGRRRLAVQLELDEEIEDGDWAGQARRLIAGAGRPGGGE